MSNLTDFLGSSKPKLITRYTSGTGTYIPTADMARCLVRIQAGGAGGHSGSYAGGGGAMVEVILRIPIAGYGYTVGAGGSVSANGSPSYFHSIGASPGTFGNITIQGAGGPLSLLAGTVDADGGSIFNGGLTGVAGGFGGTAGSTPGGLPGFPLSPTYHPNYAATLPNTIIANGFTNAQGNGSGGNSFYGFGAATGTNAVAPNYGAGGGVNGTGCGGCIEIWDYGA